MLRLFDPTIEQPNDTEDDFDLEGEDDNMRQQLNNMIPIYSKPTVVYCVLPGEFEYLCVRKPDLLKRAEEARKEPNYVCIRLLRVVNLVKTLIIIFSGKSLKML